MPIWSAFEPSMWQNIWHGFSYCLGAVFVKQYLEILHQQGLSLDCGSNNNTLRIRERVEWMVCHSDHKYLYQRLLQPQSSILWVGVMRILYQKNLDLLFWQV